MDTVMSHKEWMKLTYGGVTSIRSSKLKAVDAALLKYENNKNPANKQGIMAALQNWISSKGGAWKASIRNKHNAVENLHKQLTGLGAKSHDPVALSHVRDEARAIITDLFYGKQLVFRPGLLTKLAGNNTLAKLGVMKTPVSMLHNANTASGGAITRGVMNHSSTASSAAAKSHDAHSLAKSLFNDTVPADLVVPVKEALAQVMPGFMHELTASCAPFVGIGYSAAATVKNAYTMTKAMYRLSQGQMHAQRTLSTEEPEAAMQAVVGMLSREAEDKLAGFTRGLTEFGAKLVSMLADGGTASNAAIGLASSMVKLLMLLRIIVRDVGESKAANLLLKKPVITAELFQTCPLMGAYLVCCAPTSVIVNTVLSSDKFYQPGMMDRVERAVQKHIEPMREQARRLVKKHRMYIPALQSFPGILKPNKKNLKKMQENMGKSGMVGFGSN